MSDISSSSSLISSASSSSSLSTSAATTTSSSTLTISTTSSDLLSTATTATSTAPIETTTSSSTTSTTSTSTSSIATVTTTSTPSPTLAPPITTFQSTSTTPVVPVVTTATSVIVVSPSLTQAPSRTAAPSSSNNTFFENKGAVAGVFTVVGLIVVALFVILVFIIIRRRRANQFDREVEAAAAEAAAAPAPHFLDDDEDDDPYRHHADQPAVYADHPQYSDISSHGTYSQPALGSQEAYGMRDLGSAPGELYNNSYVSGGAAGAAGVGVARARSTRDPGAFASGFQDGATPYPAFAGPAAFQSGAYGNSGGYDSMGTGVGAGVGAGMQRGMSLNHHPNVDSTNDQRQHYSQGLHPGQYVQQSDLVRNPSQVTTHASSTLVGSSASPKEQSPYTANYTSAPVQEVDEGAYGGYTDDLRGAGHMSEGRHSYQHDDEDEGRPKILKVANE